VLRFGRDQTVRTRTYDLYITYDKYWACPRLWLFGYTALGAPLPVQAIMEDISTDYVDKTVTVETWPYLDGASMSMATVHPCKHSHVMQILISRWGEQVRVDQYPPPFPIGFNAFTFYLVLSPGIMAQTLTIGTWLSF
jgi:ubiquitin-like-conjugating enzyme ATG3